MKTKNKGTGKTLLAILPATGVLFAICACGKLNTDTDADEDTGGDSGSDDDTDTDVGSDTDTDADTDTDTGSEPAGDDPCDQKTQAINDAVGAFCSDKDDFCCWCKCYNQGKDYEYDDDPVTCECLEPDTEEADAGDETCEGEELEEAEECLDDLEECMQPFVNNADWGCNMTLL